MGLYTCVSQRNEDLYPSHTKRRATLWLETCALVSLGEVSLDSGTDRSHTRVAPDNHKKSVRRWVVCTVRYVCSSPDIYDFPSSNCSNT